MKKLKLIALFFLYQNVHAQTFTLNGTVTNKDTGTVVLNYVNANNKPCSDTTTISQGKFQFNGMVAGTDHAYFDTDPFVLNEDKNCWTRLFIEPGVINMSFKYGDMKNARIDGSNLQKQYDAFYESKINEIQKLVRLSSSADSIRTLLKNGSLDPKLADQKIKDLNKRYAPIQQSLNNTDLSYIRNHPNSYVSLALLDFLVGRIPGDSVDIYYPQLSGEVKNSSLDHRFLEHYSLYKKVMGNDFPFDRIKMNEPAPRFALYKTDSDSISLDVFKGSVVLLEFWELTCMPCLQANPLIEKLRQGYNEKEFRVIAITSSPERELSKLNTYMEKNKLSQWIHVSTSNEFRKVNGVILNGDFSNYHRLGVPRTILIDKSGKVIYKHLGFSVEDMSQLELLVKKSVSESIN